MKVLVPLDLVMLMSCDSGIVLSTEGAKTCSAEIGASDGGCPSKCLSRYPGGQGTCSPRQTCMCYFDCGPITPQGQKLKTCHTSISFCGARCNDEKCNLFCHEKYPTPKQARKTTFPFLAKQCTFNIL